MALGWADKIAWGFTLATNQSGDRLTALQRLSIYAFEMGMIWVRPTDIGAPVFPEKVGINEDGGRIGLMSNSLSNPRGVLRAGDLVATARFGARVVQILRRSEDRYLSLPVARLLPRPPA
ncbi:MAG: hypothetical protein AAGG57_07230 [Pseudomonadota bacterium]